MSLTQEVTAERNAERARLKANPRPPREDLGYVMPLPDWALPLVPRPVKDASMAFAKAKRSRDKSVELGAQKIYIAAVNAHREAISEAAESRLRTVRGEVASLVDQLEEALLARDTLAKLADEVAEPIEGRHPVFTPTTRSRLGAKRTKALIELRAQ